LSTASRRPYRFVSPVASMASTSPIGMSMAKSF
jgi:hypothetical protein